MRQGKEPSMGCLFGILALAIVLPLAGWAAWAFVIAAAVKWMMS